MPKNMIINVQFCSIVALDELNIHNKPWVGQP